MTPGYTIQQHDHGIAVFGEIPLDDMEMLTTYWGKRGFKVIDFGVAQVLGATFAVVKDKKGGEAWRKAIGATPENPDWLMSGDCGLSSKTIYAVLAKRPGVIGRDGPYVPLDPDDFGRCYRLLKRYPDWRGRLGEVAEKYPMWAGLVREWDKLTALYEEELPRGTAPKLYAEMRRIEGR